MLSQFKKNKNMHLKLAGKNLENNRISTQHPYQSSEQR
jgi:hypothetical protein